MIRKIGFTLLCAGGLLTTQTFATTYHNFQKGLSIDYELPVNDPQVFSNIFFWQIKATCIISSKSVAVENPLSVKMVHKTGQINETRLSENQSITLTVQAGDRLDVIAESGAKVKLVNQGTQPIKASCTT